MAKVGFTPAKFDFRTQTIADLQKKMPKLVATARRVSALSEVSFQYLIASMYVESGLDANARNGHAKGIAQIKGVAWKEAIATDLFKTIWTKLAPEQKIPSGPGKSMEADIVALAVLTKQGDRRCKLVEILKQDEDNNKIRDEEELKDKARRLCYHLSPSTAAIQIQKLLTGSVAFSDASNQISWNRFSVVLDKAKLIRTIAKAK